MEDLSLFFRLLMAANSITLFLAGRLEGHRSATAASLLLLVGAAAWAGPWAASLVTAYWLALAVTLAWVARDGLQELGWVPRRRR